MTEMLKIVDLHAEAGEREILKGVNLTVNEGETCVLFGPNGSGKSTLLATIMEVQRLSLSLQQLMKFLFHLTQYASLSMMLSLLTMMVREISLVKM